MTQNTNRGRVYGKYEEAIRAARLPGVRPAQSGNDYGAAYLPLPTIEIMAQAAEAERRKGLSPL